MTATYQPPGPNTPTRSTGVFARAGLVIQSVLLCLRTLMVRARADESGNVITDNLAWIVFGVIAIVAIGAAISGLGSDVVNWVKGELGT